MRHGRWSCPSSSPGCARRSTARRWRSRRCRRADGDAGAGPRPDDAPGRYAGDARIEDLAPGQERLLSYALDLKTECEVLPRGGRQDLITVTLRKGTLIATRKVAEAVDYTVRNRDRKL